MPNQSSMTGATKSEVWMKVGQTLAELTRQWEELGPKAEAEQQRAKFGALPPSPEAIASVARSYLRLRRRRERIAPGLFFDRAWDILLDLFAAAIEGRQVSVSSACIASSVPATTALRHIDRLWKEGFLARFADPHDGRRIFVSITERGKAMVGEFLINLHNH
jgi:hypothetical protein